MEKITFKTMLIIGIMSLSAINTFAVPPTAEAVEAETVEMPRTFIRDGFAFPNNGIIGKVTRNAANDKWYFTADTDVSDGKGLIKAGEATEVLPSSTLEKIILTIQSDPNNNPDSLDIKLWGKITRYSNQYTSKDYFYGKARFSDKIYTKNFIFAAGFNKLLVAAPDESEQAKPKTETPEETKSIIPSEAHEIFKSQREERSETDDAKTKGKSIIPSRITKKFKLKKVEDLSKWKKGIGVEGDAMLSNRIGFFVKSGDNNIFRLDALGRNVIGTEFKLLPCETLQWAQLELAKNPGRLRYKISGTITKFKGEYYLLLQRSVRTFNHGNFSN